MVDPYGRGAVRSWQKSLTKAGTKLRLTISVHRFGYYGQRLLSQWVLKKELDNYSVGNVYCVFFAVDLSDII